jgi:hypothetical protein
MKLMSSMNSKNLVLSVTLAIATVVMATCTKAFAEVHLEQQGAFPSQKSPASPGNQTLPQAQLVSQAFSEDQEFEAFFSSQYTYCDAETLAEYWGMNLGEAKMRMGRKILWGDADVGILEQYLVDARLEALRFMDANPDQALCYYDEQGYSYEDAVDLAAYWGDADSWETKLRIERNLLLNNDDVVSQALRLARQ